MNQILFPRVSYDGSIISKTDLEDWYISAKVEKKDSVSGKKITKAFIDIIETNLNSIIKNNSKEERLLNSIKGNLKSIILYSPEKLMKVTKIIDNYFHDILINSKGETTSFNKDILEAFGYGSYRGNILIKLAEKLNIKSCPYCNMHYTLFAEDGNRKDDRLAKFQYDHFFDKAEYPFLSMSLYNLIPSCGICNQSKSKGKLSLKFHPYKSNIADQFYFSVNNPLSLLIGAKDRIEIKLNHDSSSEEEVSEFNQMFNIQTLYRRHRDVAQEVFDKAYMESYYGETLFFKFLNKPLSKEYLGRLLYGTYLENSDIEKRPMSKFIQDLRKQALSNFMIEKTDDIHLPQTGISVHTKQ